MNTEYTLKEVNEETLGFFFALKSYELYNKGHRDDLMYLRVVEGLFSLSFSYAIYHNGKIVAYAIIPKYSPYILTRMYVLPEHRRKGIASFLINHFKITSLSCLKDNETGLLFYKKLGFKIERAHSHIFDLTREFDK